MSTTETLARPVAVSSAHPARRLRRRRPWVVGTVLSLGAVATAFPFAWMIVSAVKPRRESMAYPPHVLPQHVTLEYFVQLMRQLDFGRYLVNTLAVVAISMVGLVLMAMAGFGFAKFTFRGKEPIFFLVLTTMMIPVQVTMIPTYLILNAVGLTNTLLGIAMPTLVSAFGVFMFRQFMTTIPTEVIEAARIDGAGEARIFGQIVLPMSRPILAVQVVLTFISGWNSFLWPLVIASDQNLYTLSVGIALLNQQVATNPSLQMAAAALMVVPVLVVFVIFQRHIVQGFALSGLK